MGDTLDTTVTSIHQMTPTVKQFVLDADDHVFDFRPGQHTHVHFEDEEGEEVVRPYTSTALPGTSRITLAIKRYPDGAASTWMHEREPGDAVTLEPLGGNLYLRDFSADVALVASGTGLTPMIAMAKQYLLEGDGRLDLLFGEKDQAHLFYRETLDQFAAAHDDFHVTYSLSEESWAGPEGHIQEHLDDRLPDFDREFYVCGVPEMVVETTDVLDDRGVPDDRVFTEGWEGDEVADTG